MARLLCKLIQVYISIINGDWLINLISIRVKHHVNDNATHAFHTKNVRLLVSITIRASTGFGTNITA